MNNRTARITGVYLLGIACLLLYYYLETSTLLPELIERTKDGRYGDFPAFFLGGLVKYGMLVAGIAMILILTFLIIQRKFEKNK